MKLYLDTKEFNAKPLDLLREGEEYTDVQMISTRITKNPVDLEPLELAQEIIKGKTVALGIMKGHKLANDKLYSQEVVAVDFDNKPNNPIQYTIEDALKNEFIKENALFLYTSFSHTKSVNRFRVVFRLDKAQRTAKDVKEIYENIYKKFNDNVQDYVIDKACKNPSRLFYGGTRFIEINFNNKINTKDLVQGKIEQLTLFNNENMKNLKIWELIRSQMPEADKEVKSRLTEKYEQVTVRNSANAKEYIKTLDMREILELPKTSKFPDILDEDENPSASVYKFKGDNKTFLYKRFNHGDSFDIIRLVSKLRGINNTHALIYLSEMLNVKYGEGSEEIKKINKVIDEFQHHMLTVDLSDQYPQTHKLLKDGRSNYGRDISDILEIMRNYVIEVDGVPRLISHLSLRELSIRIYGNDKRDEKISRVLQYMHRLGFISKLSDGAIPKDVLDGILKYKIDRNFSKKTDVYEMKDASGGKDPLVEIERKAGECNSKKTTFDAMTKQGNLMNYGTEFVKNYYVQDAEKGEITLTKETLIAHEESLKIAMSKIEEQGYVENNDIINHLIEVFGSKTKGRRKFNESKNYLKEAYGLTEVNLNKELKKELNVPSDKYSPTQSPKIMLLDK